MTDTLDAAALRALADAVETVIVEWEQGYSHTNNLGRGVYECGPSVALYRICRTLWYESVYYQALYRFTRGWDWQPYTGGHDPGNFYLLRALVAAIRRDAAELEVQG